MIIGTTSMKNILQELEVVDCFNVSMNIPLLKNKQEFTAVLSNFNGTAEEVDKISQELVAAHISNGGIPVKNLKLSIELSLQKSIQGKLEHFNFLQSLSAVNQ